MGWFALALLIVQLAVFLIFREESYLQVHDNLDLFMAHYRMISRNHAWFSHGVTLPMLHGVSRDLLGSEWNLYNLCYILLPGVYAYLTGYFLKILIGFFSFLLLAKEVYAERFSQALAVLIPAACAFSMIPVFPTYGIAFTSVPLILYLSIRLYRSAQLSVKKRLLLYLCVFLYPLLSYFSYHGFFILCYLLLAAILLSVRDRRPCIPLFVAVIVLSAGYILFEYRLFYAMLFDSAVTIRTTMSHGDMTLSQSLLAGVNEFVKASFHSQDSHTYLVLPVVLAGGLVWNIRALYTKKKEETLTLFNLTLLWIVFNCLNFGLYLWRPYRTLLETLVPKLTGFEFARTSYFNTFLWYAALALVLVRLSFARHAKALPASLLAGMLAALIVMFVPQVYNDFYDTCYNQAYRILKKGETTYLNYREFYSEDLFDHIREDLGYDGAWSCAYGLHPSVLNYNGIATLDGYLGMYPQSYKEAWRRVIAPALETAEWNRAYFDSWGARVVLCSASDENTYAPLRNLPLQDTRLVADTEALKELGCTYIFSRIAFSNADEAGLTLEKVYEGFGSPYTIYVYTL